MCHTPQVRGAALKLGQIISMQDGLLPAPLLVYDDPLHFLLARTYVCSYSLSTLQELFERVRQSADYMPFFQTEAQLRSELGPLWRDNFESFSDKPFAAASIGQVHHAVLKGTGVSVAVKVQYPGVASSIESDLANLQMIMNLTGLLPRGLFAEQLMVVAREELTLECDYTHEAAAGIRFQKLLANDADFVVPTVVPHLSTKQVLTTTLEQGMSLEASFDLSQSVRDKIGARMLRLCLREAGEFR